MNDKKKKSTVDFKMFSKHGLVLILHVYIVTFYEVQIVVVYMSRISGLRIMSWLYSATRLSLKLYMHKM